MEDTKIITVDNYRDIYEDDSLYEMYHVEIGEASLTFSGYSDILKNGYITLMGEGFHHPAEDFSGDIDLR